MTALDLLLSSSAPSLSIIVEHLTTERSLDFSLLPMILISMLYLPPLPSLSSLLTTRIHFDHKDMWPG
jgi:lipopolysaccharide biosynthesis protein